MRSAHGYRRLAKAGHSPAQVIKHVIDNMAFIRHRGKTYSVVYKILDENGEEHTTSETFATQKEADKRKKEIEYKQSIGKFEVQKCATLKELIEEYVQIYGHDKWGVSTYSGNVALINNYILPTIGDTKLASINTHFMEKYYKDLLKIDRKSVGRERV